MPMVGGRVLARCCAVLVTAIAIVGCKTQQTVSLGEARSVTAKFVGRTFEAPPRSADDLVELAAAYDRPPRTDQLELLRRKAAATPTSAVIKDTVRHARFLKTRAMARRDLGDLPGALEDGRRALRLAAGRLRDGEFLREIAWVELEAGNFGRAAAIARMALKHAPADTKHVHHGQLLQFAVWQGEIDEAKRYLRLVEIAVRGKRHQNQLYSGLESIARAEGRWIDAERAARWLVTRVPRLYRGDWVQNSVSLATVRLSKSLVGQGRLQEAELVLRERLLQDLVRHGSSRAPMAAKTYVELGTVYLRAGRPDDALALAYQACSISDRLKLGWQAVLGGRASCVDLRARSSLALRRLEAARAAYDEIKAGFGRANPKAFASFARDDPNRLLTEILTGPADDTGDVVDDLDERLARRLGVKHYWSAEAKALKAALLARTGRPEAALPLFREAFAIMTKRSRRAGDADTSLVRQRFIYLAEIYLDALADVLDGERSGALVDEAFRVAAEARAQRVTAAASANVSRARIDDPALAELARREQDAQRQIESLHALLARAALRGGSEATVAKLRTQVDELRGARAAIFEELEGRYPEYASLINPKPPRREVVQRALRHGEALVSFYFTDRRGLVFVVPKSGPTLMVNARIPRHEVADRVATLRAALEPDAVTVGDIPAFDVDTAWSLYRDLLRPARDTLESASHLVVVNHGATGQLPLAVLVTEPSTLDTAQDLLFAEYRDVPWLARRWSSVIVPSGAAFVAGRSSQPPPPMRRELVAFGDPVFHAGQAAANVQVASVGMVATRGLTLHRRSTPMTLALRRAGLTDLPPLPDTRDEVEAIAVALNANLAEDVFVGADASEGRVKAIDLSDRRVVVFATHGLVPGDLDGLSQPALALSAPRFGEGGEDGLLTLSEILGLRLNADLVVLSACNTAAGDGAGAEAISGLARGFLYAGARSLLVSSWPVETTSARLLTTSLFEWQKKEGARWPEALRRASLALAEGGAYRLADGRAAFAYAHPLFWAPFLVVGGGGT